MYFTSLFHFLSTSLSFSSISSFLIGDGTCQDRCDAGDSEVCCRYQCHYTADRTWGTLPLACVASASAAAAGNAGGDNTCPFDCGRWSLVSHILAQYAVINICLLRSFAHFLFTFIAAEMRAVTTLVHSIAADYHTNI
jgi:hypothetical protein